MKGAFLSEILEVVAVMSGTKPKLRTQVSIFCLQNIKCYSHKSWGYDFKLHSCALQIHSSNFGSCTSYKLEKEKLKPPWLTFLQLISPQLNDKNWTILLFNFFVHLLPSDISFSSMPVVTPFSPLTYSLWCGWSNFLLLQRLSLLYFTFGKNWTKPLLLGRQHLEIYSHRKRDIFLATCLRTKIILHLLLLVS